MPAEYHMSTRDSQLTIAGRLFAEVDQQTARTSSSLYLSVHQVCLYQLIEPSDSVSNLFTLGRHSCGPTDFALHGSEQRRWRL